MVQSTDAFNFDWDGILSLCERCFMDAIKSTSKSQYVLAKDSFSLVLFRVLNGSSRAISASQWKSIKGVKDMVLNSANKCKHCKT